MLFLVQPNFFEKSFHRRTQQDVEKERKKLEEKEVMKAGMRKANFKQPQTNSNNL